MQKGFTTSNRLSISGSGLALENVWVVFNWLKKALSRKMEPKTFSPIWKWLDSVAQKEVCEPARMRNEHPQSPKPYFR